MDLEANQWVQTEEVVTKELKSVCFAIAEKSGMTLLEMPSDIGMPLFSLVKSDAKYLLLIVLNMERVPEVLRTLRHEYADKAWRCIYAIIPTQCKELMSRFDVNVTSKAIEQMTSLTQDPLKPPVRLYSDLALAEMQESGWKEKPEELQNEVATVRGELDVSLRELDAWDFSGLMVVVRQYRELAQAVFRVCATAFFRRYPVIPTSLCLDRQLGVVRMKVGEEETQVRLDDPAWISLLVGNRLSHSCVTIAQTWRPILYGDHQSALRNLRTFFEQSFQIAHRLLHPSREAANWLRSPAAQWRPEGMGAPHMRPWQFRETVFDELLSELPVEIKKATVHDLYGQLCGFIHNDVMSIPLIADYRKAYRVWNPFFMQALRIVNLVMASLFVKLKEGFSATPDTENGQLDPVLAVAALATSLGAFTASVQQEMIAVADRTARANMAALLSYGGGRPEKTAGGDA